MPSTLHPSLKPIDLSSHTFRYPGKRIHSQLDLEPFQSSLAYIRITSFLKHLNASISPLALSSLQKQSSEFTVPPITPDKVCTNSPTIQVSQPVQQIISLVTDLEGLVTECPPDTGPRRFGNVAFRTWYRLVEERIPALLEKHLPSEITTLPPFSSDVTAIEELKSYLLGSFGSAQRLDYGTGHELSFLAFLCGIWLLGGFTSGRDEQALALRAISAYLHLIRTLVKTYTLEPAGSHGVWGLDDHSFLPYIFGSAQLTTSTPQPGVEPDYASIGVPRPDDVAQKIKVNEWRSKNLYFDAIGFIYDVKKGPFWEHSPILFDISGVKEGWGKINIGMIKMYHAEVLGKFPVVQHFHCGSLFPWSSRGEAGGSITPHTADTLSSLTNAINNPHPQLTTIRAPWAKPSSSTEGVEDSKAPATKAPWVRPAIPGTQTHPVSMSRLQNQPPPGGAKTGAEGGDGGIPMTKAPWAK